VRGQVVAEGKLNCEVTLRWVQPLRLEHPAPTVCKQNSQTQFAEALEAEALTMLRGVHRGIKA